MSGAAVMRRPVYSVSDQWASLIRNGQSAWFIGRSDGANGWRPIAPIIVRRLHFKGNVTASDATTNILCVLFKNGVTDGSHDMLKVTQSCASTGEFIVEDETPNNQTALVTPDDFLTLRVYLDTANACSVADWYYTVEAQAA